MIETIFAFNSIVFLFSIFFIFGSFVAFIFGYGVGVLNVPIVKFLRSKSHFPRFLERASKWVTTSSIVIIFILGVVRGEEILQGHSDHQVPVTSSSNLKNGQPKISIYDPEILALYTLFCCWFAAFEVAYDSAQTKRGISKQSDDPENPS